jgi:hypothetical protein
MSVKIQGIGMLFVVLISILTLNPHFVNNMYNSFLGRIVLIGTVIFFAKNSVTLGLLSVLVIIAALNQFGSFVEGMENGTTTPVLTAAAVSKVNATNAENIEGEEDVGIDKEDIKIAIAAKNSKQIPVDRHMLVSEEVQANSETEGFALY